MKSFVVLSVLIAIAVAHPSAFGEYSGGYGGYGLEGYGGYNGYLNGYEGGYGSDSGMYGGGYGDVTYDSGYGGSYRKKRSVSYGYAVPSTYSSLVTPGAVYTPHTYVKSGVVSPVYFGSASYGQPLYDTRSVLLSPYYTHNPSFYGVHSPALATEDLLFKKKREVKADKE